MADYVVQSKVREMVKKEGMNVGSDFMDELDKKLMEMVKGAVKTAKGYNTKTLKARDL